MAEIKKMMPGIINQSLKPFESNPNLFTENMMKYRTCIFQDDVFSADTSFGYPGKARSWHRQDGGRQSVPWQSMKHLRPILTTTRHQIEVVKYQLAKAFMALDFLASIILKYGEEKQVHPCGFIYEETSKIIKSLIKCFCFGLTQAFIPASSINQKPEDPHYPIQSLVTFSRPMSGI
jgi:hypothetical protein